MLIGLIMYIVYLKLKEKYMNINTDLLPCLRLFMTKIVDTVWIKQGISIKANIYLLCVA